MAYTFCFFLPADIDDPMLRAMVMYQGPHFGTVTEAEHAASSFIGGDELAYWPAGSYEIQIVEIIDGETSLALETEIQLEEAVIDESLLETDTEKEK